MTPNWIRGLIAPPLRNLTRWSATVLCLVGLGACTDADQAGAKTKCTPGVNVFCRCADTIETGLMECLPGGQSFGECLPCDSGSVEDIGRREEDLTDPQDASRRPADTGADSSEADIADSSDAAPADSTPVKCTAFAVPLNSAKDVSLGGDTSKAKANLSGLGACAVANVSKEIVYEVVADERGKVTATVTPGPSYDAVLYERSGACGTGNQSACADATGKGVAESIVFFTEAGDKHYVIVDGKSGSSGTYALKLHLDPGSYCGDGVVDPEEACDDGNLAKGDGCSDACTPDGTPKTAQTCPGQFVHMWELPLTLSANTSDHPNAQKATCGGGGGRDAIYQVMPHRDGVMTISVTSSAFDTLIYARSGSCATGPELACANKAKDIGAETISIPVATGTAFWLFVDGYKYGKGLFKLDFTME